MSTKLLILMIGFLCLNIWWLFYPFFFWWIFKSFSIFVVTNSATVNRVHDPLSRCVTVSFGHACPLHDSSELVLMKNISQLFFLLKKWHAGMFCWRIQSISVNWLYCFLCQLLGLVMVSSFQEIGSEEITSSPEIKNCPIHTQWITTRMFRAPWENEQHVSQLQL